jgi:hypothetical protein
LRDYEGRELVLFSSSWRLGWPPVLETLLWKLKDRRKGSHCLLGKELK